MQPAWSALHLRSKPSWWAFIVLGPTIIEASGTLLQTQIDLATAGAKPPRGPSGYLLKRNDDRASVQMRQAGYGALSLYVRCCHQCAWLQVQQRTSNPTSMDDRTLSISWVWAASP